MTPRLRPPVGLHVERTVLSWRRTSLALLGATLILARILTGTLGGWAITPAAVAALLMIVTLLLARVRTASAERTQGSASLLRSPHTGPLTFVAMVATVLLGVSSLALVVTL